MTFLSYLSAVVGFACLAAATLYPALNLLALLVWRFSRRQNLAAAIEPVTILKPLCGAEPGLYEDLRSFCAQDHPQFELILGIREKSDPACDIARRIASEYPTLPITIVVDSQLHGANRKVSNLINMLPYARHDLLVMADSDACVGPDYLQIVTRPLVNSEVGLVTCVYRGTPTPGIWSRIGAMYINEWYVPSIMLAWLFGHQGYVSGQTICIRQATLRKLGGFGQLTDHLADDHRLGTLVRNLGLKIELSSYVVRVEHHEPSLDSVTLHELRWMRTLRALRPRSFRWLFLTFSLPLAVSGLALSSSAHVDPLPAALLFGLTMLLRLMLHLLHRVGHERHMLVDFWLLPLRDVLLCWVWFRSFFTSRVMWRGTEFHVDADGVMHRLT